MTICGGCGYIIRAKHVANCTREFCPHKETYKERGQTINNQNEVRVGVQHARNKLSRAQLKVKVAVAELRVQQAMCDHPGIDYTVHVPSGRVCPDCGKVVR